MNKIGLSAILGSALLFSCEAPHALTGGELPDLSTTVTGIMYHHYDSGLTDSQKMWEKKITQSAFEAPFWNAKRTQAVIYMRSRDTAHEVGHHFYFYRLNSSGWMELYGVGEFITDYYTAARKIRVDDYEFHVSLWNADAMGQQSVTITYSLTAAHVTRKKMKGADEQVSTKVFSANNLRYPYLNLKQ